MVEDKYKNYVHDLGIILKEKAIIAKRDKTKLERDASYDMGYLMAFHEIISVMKQQAENFYIDQKDIGLEDINPENDLL